MNRYNRSDKPDWVLPRSVKLLDQVRERVRYLHYSLQTEKAYVYWTKAFVLWTARSFGGFRHPRDMGQAEVEGFLTMLATEKQGSPATHRQALNALLFLYRQVLGMELPWIQQIGRSPERKRIPVVLTVQEIQTRLSHMAGTEALLAAPALQQRAAATRSAGLAGQRCGFRPPRDHCAQRQGRQRPRGDAAQGARTQVAVRFALCGGRTGPWGAAACICPMHWSASTPELERVGPGIGCFPRPSCLWTRKRALSAASTCSKKD